MEGWLLTNRTLLLLLLLLLLLRVYLLNTAISRSEKPALLNDMRTLGLYSVDLASLSSSLFTLLSPPASDRNVLFRFLNTTQSAWSFCAKYRGKFNPVASIFTLVQLKSYLCLPLVLLHASSPPFLLFPPQTLTPSLNIAIKGHFDVPSPDSTWSHHICVTAMRISYEMWELDRERIQSIMCDSRKC